MDKCAQNINPLEHSICLDIPQRLVFPNSWVTHIPFAFYLVGALKPRVIVELGTHTGNSYCSFCQAVDTLKLTTRCYAVDTWEGDVHAGIYGDEVYEELAAYHDPKYGGFSRLLRMTFDNAKDYFSDRSVDLLHIDGLHTYEAVKHDFENWLPKLTENAIVLFHDTNVRERGFGVWKYWEELTQKFDHFEFLHGNGLGMVCVGNSTETSIAKIFSCENNEPLVDFFARLGGQNEYPIEKQHLIKLLQEKDAYIDSLQANEASAINLQTMLQADLTNLHRENERLVNELQGRSENVDALSNQILQLEQSLEMLNETRLKLSNEDENLESLLLSTEKQKEDQLLSKEKQIEELIDEITDIQLSKSWRVTRPLRSLMKFVKRN